MRIRIRRATRYDPDVLVHRRLVIAMDVVRAIEETQQVSRRCLRCDSARGTAEARLGPANRDDSAPDPGEVTNRVKRHLGIVGAGLDAQVAIAGCRVERPGRRPAGAAG
jgi:hypothetical protein